jgi:hypothetical protein
MIKPETATHFDEAAKMYCNKYGYWYEDGDYQKDNDQQDWGTDRYTKLDAMPDWDEAPERATHWDAISDVWCMPCAYYKEGEWHVVLNHTGWGNSQIYIKRPVSRTAEGIPFHPNHRCTTTTPENKYVRTLIGLCGTAVQVDVDRVLEAYKPALPQLAHLAKKALCAGLRGHKDTRQDILDIIESGQNALLLHDQLEALK